MRINIKTSLTVILFAAIFAGMISCGPSGGGGGGADDSGGVVIDTCTLNGPMTANLTDAIVTSFVGNALAYYYETSPMHWYLSGSDIAADLLISIEFLYD